MITEDQIAIITEQLGREPRGCVDIAYAQNGVPVVLQMRSVVDDQPFPTLYWLCSKDLYREIARLETEGLVKRLESELAEDGTFRQAYLASQERYVAKRWQLMLDEDRQRIESVGFTRLFEQYGIGGIAKWDKIRCLHMQVADYLATAPGEPANPVGARVDELLNIRQLTLRI